MELRKSRPDIGLQGELIGETRVTSRGYFVRVERIVFEDAGGRVRLTLLRQVQGGTEFIRHMDLTKGLAEQIAPLLLEALDP